MEKHVENICFSFFLLLTSSVECGIEWMKRLVLDILTSLLFEVFGGKINGKSIFSTDFKLCVFLACFIE
jgi:hypothetical protein